MRTPFDNIMDAERDKIEAAQFAVDGKIEQGEISGAMIQLQSNSDGPDPVPVVQPFSEPDIVLNGRCRVPITSVGFLRRRCPQPHLLTLSGHTG